MGNGIEEKVTTVGTVKGEASNKSGKLQGTINLSGVTFLKNGRYNLLSVTNMGGNVKVMRTQFCWKELTISFPSVSRLTQQELSYLL
jgi:hypothetical protein